jgi:hypothetical protein
VRKTHQRGRSFGPVGDCDASARSIRVTASRLCWLVAIMIVSCFRCPMSLGQTPAPRNVQVSHDSWTFKAGAPEDVTCLAQTNDGFLWLGGPNGLFRFDGTRFEPFSSPFGDRLLSTNLYFLFAPPSGGLWIGYATWGLTALFLRESKAQACDRLFLESDFEGAVRAWGRRQHERPGRTCPDRQTMRQCVTFRSQYSGYRSATVAPYETPGQPAAFA